MDFQLRALQQALTLARLRHYGRAAVALKISQPALSRSIATLEAKLGATLFLRGRGGVALTAAGELFVARATNVVSDITDLRRDIALIRGFESGELRIGAGLYPAALSVGTALGQLARTRPGLRVSLMAEQWQRVTAAVVRREIDLAVVELSTLEGNSRLNLEPLPAHPAAFVCGPDHPLLGRASPTLKQILNHPLVGPLYPPRVNALVGVNPVRWRYDELGNLVPPFHVESIPATVQILLGSEAVALLPLLLVEAELKTGTLHVIPYQAPWMQTQYGFAYPKTEVLSAISQTFMATVRDLEKQQVIRSAILEKAWLPKRRRR